MATYNFSEVSDFEFEELCRDLLQAELGASLELFAPGPDEGIDIRYIGCNESGCTTIVAQCKRWAEDSFARLLRHLRKVELPKVEKLGPQRYILMTSVKLTPDRKDRIVEALKPWIKTPHDVMGKHDISGLLARHREIERRHLKLWLTSGEVLDALLNSDIYNRSEGALEQAKRQLRLWVPNESFARAREVLEANHVCVISGAPGIGKTMLANVLSVGYVSKGYELIAISEDIDEGERAWRSNVRQVFLYDDFLGHVTYGELRLRKNEDSRLAKFLDRVRRTENKRFILTTREYILSEALRRYERLSNMELAKAKSIVSLQDYTHGIRGRILYNHLFFSTLPSNLKTALLPNKRYWDVIRHGNYNPRVIEHFVSLPGVVSFSPDEFVSNTFATLEDPTKVWDVIFENLPDMARRIMLAVASLPTEVYLDDVRSVVTSISPSDFDASRFKNAIGMVEGTFIDIREVAPGLEGHQRIVVIRDPSVRDYLWARLEAVNGEADALIEHSIFFEQCVILYEGRNHVDSMRPRSASRKPYRNLNGNVVGHEVVARRAADLIDSPSPVLSRWNISGLEILKKETKSLERRTTFLMDLFAAHQTSQVVAASAGSVLDAIVGKWKVGLGSPNEGLEMLKHAAKVKGFANEDVLEDAGRALYHLTTTRLEEKEDFEALIGLSTLDPRIFAEPQRALESWSSKFEIFLYGERDWLLEEIDDPDWLEDEIRRIGRIAAKLGMDISELEAAVESRMGDLRTEWECDSDADIPELHTHASHESEMEEVDALFQSLRLTHVVPCN